MLGGESFFADSLRIGLAYDGTDSHSGDGTGTFGWNASLQSLFIFNIASVLPGLQMSIESANSPTPAYIWSFAIPELSLADTVTGSSYETSVSTHLILRGFNPIETFGSPWRLFFSSIEWYVNGTLAGSYGGATMDASGLGPGYVPLLGIAPKVTGGINPGATGYPLTSEAEWTASTSGKITVSYEFKPTSGDSWQNLPVAIPAPVLPACFGACPHCLSASGIVTGTNTSEVDINLFRQTGLITIEAGGKYFTRGDVTNRGGELWLIPNLPKNLVKLGGSYAAVVERTGFPYTQQMGTRSCGPAVPPPGPPVPSPYIETRTTVSEVHPSYSSFLGTIQDAHHVIEDPLDEVTWMPIYASNSVNVGQWVEIGDSGEPINPALWPTALQDFEVETVTYTFPSKVQHRTKYGDPNSQMASYLTWSDDQATPTEINNVVTYTNYIAHPHWSYTYKARNWKIDGADVAFADYWGYICDQHTTHPALPPEDNLRTRTSLVSAPLLFGGNQGFIEAQVTGTPTSWLGIPGTNLRIDRPTIPASVIGTGPDRWTLTDCTASFGATTVTATSTGASTIKLKYDLANWNYSPRMLTSLAKRFTIGWTATNIVSVAVKLIGIDGAEHTLTSVPGTFDWPLGRGNLEYAGTWAQDFGAGVITDTGTDLLPEGDSIAAMGDNSRVIAFQYLSARGAKYLEYEITVSNTANPVTLNLPVFLMPSPDWTVVHEGSQFASALDPEGPAIRFGASSFWNYVLDSYQYPPTVLGPTSKPTVIDWLSFRESVLRGNDPNATIDGLIAGYFRNGREYTLRKHLAVNTVAWMMAYSGGLQGVMYNTYCPPPLALFPGRARDGELSPATGWDQKVYSFTQHKRNHITPANPSAQQLKKAPGANWLTPQPAPDGWKIDAHTHEVEGDETDYVLSLAGQGWGEMRPFHGHFWVQGEPLPSEGSEMFATQTADGRYLLLTVPSGDVRLYRAEEGSPIGGFSVAGDLAGLSSVVSGSICVDADLQRIRTAVEIDGEIFVGFSDDDAKTVGGFGSIAMGKRPLQGVGSQNEVLLIYFRFTSGDSGPGTLYGRFKPADSSAFGSEFTLSDGSPIVVADQFSFANPVELRDGQARWLLTVLRDGASAFETLASYDAGETWETL